MGGQRRRTNSGGDTSLATAPSGSLNFSTSTDGTPSPLFETTTKLSMQSAFSYPSFRIIWKKLLQVFSGWLYTFICHDDKCGSATAQSH